MSPKYDDPALNALQKRCAKADGWRETKELGWHQVVDGEVVQRTISSAPPDFLADVRELWRMEGELLKAGYVMDYDEDQQEFMAVPCFGQSDVDALEIVSHSDRAVTTATAFCDMMETREANS